MTLNYDLHSNSYFVQITPIRIMEKDITIDEEQTITNGHHIMSVTATAIPQKLLQAMCHMWMFNEATQYGSMLYLRNWFLAFFDKLFKKFQSCDPVSVLKCTSSFSMLLRRTIFE